MLLDLDIEEIYSECDKLKDTHVTYNWLLETFHRRHTKALQLDSEPGTESVRDGHMSMCMFTSFTSLDAPFLLTRVSSTLMCCL